MGVTRTLLLAASQSHWLRERASRYGFVRRAVLRFMPGEDVEDALAAAREFSQAGLSAVFTRLGENVTEEREAAAVTRHYLELLRRMRELALPGDLSVKLTQLGLDLSPELCHESLCRILERAGRECLVWIDMESSPYVDRTLEQYRRARARFPNVGVCLQAYLYRTEADLESLLPLAPAIRLVKGAYRETREHAYPRRRDVDANFARLAARLLDAAARQKGMRVAIGTHDLNLIRRAQEHAEAAGLGKDAYEFQMLYGIQRPEQLRLAREGYRAKVLISYGNYWFPWYMRRLAERPANVWFVVRNLFSG